MILFEDQMKCKSAFYEQFMFIDFYVTGMTYIGLNCLSRLLIRLCVCPWVIYIEL